MYNKRYYFSLCAFLLSFSATTHSATLFCDGQPFVTFTGGYQFGQTRINHDFYIDPNLRISEVIDKSNVNRAFIGFEIGEEYVLTPFLLQIGIGYYQPRSLSGGGTIVHRFRINRLPFIQTNAFNYHYKVMTQQLLLETKFSTNMLLSWHPYILAGIGGVNNRTYANRSFNPFPAITPRYRSTQHNSTNTSYELGAGLDVDATCFARFGFGYKYTNLGKIPTGSLRLRGSNFKTTRISTQSKAQEIFVQLTVFIGNYLST